MTRGERTRTYHRHTFMPRAWRQRINGASNEKEVFNVFRAAQEAFYTRAMKAKVFDEIKAACILRNGDLKKAQAEFEANLGVALRPVPRVQE